jgi:hypothetical protein
VITGLCTIILYPTLQDKESGYVHAFVDLLPTGWRGFMLAGFAAAYMSTIGTQLNWGASYLVNDFYKRFINRDAGDKHYVNVSRWATIFLFMGSIVVTWQLSSVEQAWRLLLALGAGTGLVLILRWYWWRINAWSEISAMITSFVVAIVVLGYAGRMLHAIGLTRADFGVPQVVREGGPNADAWVMVITVAITTVVWVAVTFLTAPEPDSMLESFYRRVRPGGPGWARVSRRLGVGTESIPGGKSAWTNWIAGIVAVYGTLFGTGKIIFGYMGEGLVLCAVALAAFLWIARSFRSEDQEPVPIPPPDARTAPWPAAATDV